MELRTRRGKGLLKVSVSRNLGAVHENRDYFFWEVSLTLLGRSTRVRRSGAPPRERVPSTRPLELSRLQRSRWREPYSHPDEH